MLTVLTWNLENMERPAAAADDDARAAYTRKLNRIVEVIAGANPDLVAVQEVLAAPGDPAPAVFEDLRSTLSDRSGQSWQGFLSRQPDGRGIRVGWLSPGRLRTQTEVAAYPEKVPAVTVDDDGTTITAAKRGALAVSYVRDDGLEVRALTAHFKSKLLTFPGHDAEHPRFDTRDEAERARYGLYALAQRSAEAATVRAWATAELHGAGQQRHVLVCGDLNDTPEAATTQLLLGRPGSQLGTGGFAHSDWGDGNRLWNLAPAMPAGDPDTGEEPANWSRINNGVPELIDQILVSHALVHTLDATRSLQIEGVRSVTADPASLTDLEAPSDHRPVVASFAI